MKKLAFLLVLFALLPLFAEAQTKTFTIFSPGPSGPVKSNGTYALQQEFASDIAGLWSGCSTPTTMFLRADGACQLFTSGTVTSLTGGTGITLTPNPITTSGTISLATPVSVANGGTGVGTITGLLLGTGTTAITPYVGTSCTNQFPRSLNASGVATCNSVALASDVTGGLGAVNGGTGITTYALGDLIYGFNSTTIGKLPGSIVAAKRFLTQTGNGTISASPAWGTIAATDVTPAGSTTQVQYNNAGALAGASGLTYNVTTGAVSVGTATTGDALLVAGGGKFSGTISRSVATSNVETGVVGGTIPMISLANSASTTDNKGWDLNVSGTGFLCNEAYNDALSVFISTLCISHTGNVTINSPNAGFPLNVLGTASTNYAVAITNTTAGSATSHMLNASNNADADFNIDISQAGSATKFAKLSPSVGGVVTQVGNGSVQFLSYGAGTLTTSATGVITATSDERLKNIRGPFKRSLDDIQRIDPISYTWKKGDDPTVYSGFSAQNMQGAIPEAVGHNSDGMLTLQDRPILAALVNSIKQQEREINMLWAAVALSLTISALSLFTTLLYPRRKHERV